VLTDIFGHYEGPLAGIATGLREAQTDLVLFVPCDSPLLSPQLVKRLYICLIEAKADVSVAENGGRIQPVFALLKRNLLPDLLAFLESGERKISDWYTRQALVQVDCSDIPDTFLNINTPQELNELAARLAATQSFQKRDKSSQNQSTK
jgi:molybdopterin-guanine dinucleotide biosynthesis protein A